MDSPTIENAIHEMIIYLLKNSIDVSWFEDNFGQTIYNTDDDNNEISSNEAYNQDFDFDFVVTNVDTEEMIDENNAYLSSNSALSTEAYVISKEPSHTTTDLNRSQTTTIEKGMKRSLTSSAMSDVASKKLRDDNNEASEASKHDYIPNYLQTTNERFQFVITVYLKSTANLIPDTVSFEDLQSFALLKHRIALVKLQRKLWESYLKLGTGQWETLKPSKVDKNDRCFWPSFVRSKASSFMQTVSSEDEQKFYETFVNNHLQELDQLLAKYLDDYNTKKSSLTMEIEQILGAFVQHFGMKSREIKFNYKAATVQYEYETHLLESEYRQNKPNEYQLRIAERLYFLQHEYIQAKVDLLEYKERILYNNPPKSLSSVALSAVVTKNNKEKVENESLLYSDEKQVQKTLTDLMMDSVSKLEKQVSDTRELLERELSQISINASNDDKSLTNRLVDIIFKRFKIIRKKLEHIADNRMYYIRKGIQCYLGQDDGSDEETAEEEEEEEEVQQQRQTVLNNEHISFSPTVVINTLSHQFTDEELKHLSRGPSYIPACQLYASSSTSTVPFRDMVEKQYKILQHNLNILFAKYDMNTARSMFINKTIKDLYMKTFDTTLPKEAHERAVYEKRLVQSIRNKLKLNDLVIRRTSDLKNVFYVTNRKDFEASANDSLSKTDAFELCNIKSSNESDTNSLTSVTTVNLTSQTVFDSYKQMIKPMNSELQKILHNTKVYKELLDKLIYDENKVQLPYLYFLPDISKNDVVTLQPVIVAQYGATARLAQFLNELFEPLLERQSLSRSFKNGTDFIQKLNHYATERKCLHAKTFFIKLTITNFHTITSHTVMLSVLERFLRDHLAVPGIGNLSIQKLIDLTAVFLNHNYFFYNNRIYRCMKGAPSSLPLLNTLSQIYAYQWQNILLNQSSIFNNELFGRCKNELFFTWNQTTDECRQFFTDLSQKDTDIRYKTSIGYQVQFLNINIENRRGTLYTNICREETLQKYTLPYVIGHAQVAYSHWLQSALIRAVRYCTSVEDFNRERIYLEIICLAHGYPIDFIERRMSYFYTHFDVKPLRTVLDQNLYNKLRERLFNFIRTQKQLQIENDELEKHKRRFQLTYLYDYGSKRQFNQQLQKVVSDYVNTNLHLSANEKIKIIPSTIQQYSLNALLSEQQPREALFSTEKKISA